MGPLICKYQFPESQIVHSSMRAPPLRMIPLSTISAANWILQFFYSLLLSGSAIALISPEVKVIDDKCKS